MTYASRPEGTGPLAEAKVPGDIPLAATTEIPGLRAPPGAATGDGPALSSNGSRFRASEKARAVGRPASCSLAPFGLAFGEGRTAEGSRLGGEGRAQARWGARVVGGGRVRRVRRAGGRSGRMPEQEARETTGGRVRA